MNTRRTFNAMPAKAATMSCMRAFVAHSSVIAPEKKPATGKSKAPTPAAARGRTSSALEAHAMARMKLKQDAFAANAATAVRPVIFGGFIPEGGRLDAEGTPYRCSRQNPTDSQSVF